MIRALLLGLVALAWFTATAAAAKPHLFGDEAPLKIVITGPFPTIVRLAATSTKLYSATLTVTDDGAPPQTVAIQIAARGHSRRQEYCSFPPILLRFDKPTARGTLFQGQHKLKLTTYCKPPQDYEQRIVLEYLAYKIYNLITPMSFRVRAAEVTFRGSESDAGVTRFGFLIEDPDDLAARNDAARLKVLTHQVAVAQLDPRATARAELFEFLIANFDWEFLAASAGEDCCHNIRLIAAKGATAATASGVVPAPYDFDSSGFVDSPYAEIPAGLGIGRVTERVYRGYCASNGEIAPVVQEYNDHRAAIMALINGDPRLDEHFRTKTDHFVDGFYTTINDPPRLQRDILRHCR
jgi:hypothetical protein